MYECAHVYTCEVKAQNLSTSPDAVDRHTAHRLGRASLWVSVSGIILGIIMTITLICLLVAGVSQICPFPANGKCYMHREISQAECLLKLYKDHYYDPITGYCYYNDN